jgi:tRNA splicing endonuclease
MARVMKRQTILLLIMPALLLSGCNLAGPEERAIGQMVETFVHAIDQSDDDLAYACLMDQRAFETLNPSASARVDAESFMDEYMSELIQMYRDLKEKYRGRYIKFKKFRLGTPFYQYKGFSAFKDNEVEITVDGETETINILKIVRVGDRWLIVSLGSYEY